jgi:hypothetical protein
MSYADVFNTLCNLAAAKTDASAMERYKVIQDLVSEINRDGLNDLRLVPELSSPSIFVLTFERGYDLSHDDCIPVGYREPELTDMDIVLARIKNTPEQESKGGFSIVKLSDHGVYDVDIASERDTFIYEILETGAAIRAEKEKIANFQRQISGPSARP